MEQRAEEHFSVAVAEAVHLGVLRSMIRRSGRDRESLKEKLDGRKRWVDEVLDGHQSLAYVQIFALLDAIGAEPDDYFAEVVGELRLLDLTRRLRNVVAEDLLRNDFRQFWKSERAAPREEVTRT